MKTILYLLIISFAMCGTHKTHSLHFNPNQIDSVIITDNTKLVSKKIDDKQLIGKIFNDYINNASVEPRKFIPKYKISFVYKKYDYELLINSYYLKVGGISYKVDYDMEQLLRTEMKINQH